MQKGIGVGLVDGKGTSVDGKWLGRLLGRETPIGNLKGAGDIRVILRTSER